MTREKAFLRGFINLGIGKACPSVSGTNDGRACRYDEALSDRAFNRIIDRFYSEPENGYFTFTSEKNS